MLAFCFSAYCGRTRVEMKKPKLVCLGYFVLLKTCEHLKQSLLIFYILMFAWLKNKNNILINFVLIKKNNLNGFNTRF